MNLPSALTNQPMFHALLPEESNDDYGEACAIKVIASWSAEIDQIEFSVQATP